VGTVTGSPGLLKGQDMITPTSTATADSTCQKSAPGCISSALVKSARCRPCMRTTSHVTAYAPTSHCMDPQEEAYTLEDILYLDYENRTD
jgi:hypothetical protein